MSDKYLLEWIKETYPMMINLGELDELDWWDMQKFSIWLVKKLNK